MVVEDIGDRVTWFDSAYMCEVRTCCAQLIRRLLAVHKSRYVMCDCDGNCDNDDSVTLIAMAVLHSSAEV